MTGWFFGDKEEIIIRFRNATTPRSPGGANKQSISILKMVKLGNFSETQMIVWDSLGLSGTILGSHGTIEDPLGPFGTLKFKSWMGWDFEDKGEIIIKFRNATTPRSPDGANKQSIPKNGTTWEFF